MNKYEVLEKAVFDRLDLLTAVGYGVQIMPETKEEYKKPSAKRGTLVVAYKGSDFDAGGEPSRPRVQDAGAVLQTERMVVEVIHRCRRMRGEGGMFELRALVQKMLLGYKVAGFTKFAAVKFEFVGYEESIWVYSYSFECSAPAVETPDELPEVLTTQITVDTITVTTDV